MLKIILEAPDKAPLHNFPYILYLPDGYDEDEREWPLVVYLHGAGERGRDLKTPYAYGIPQRIKDGDSFPFIFVAPQCDDPLYWAGCIESLDAFLDDRLRELRVDRQRIYLTGASMGGMGTWMWGVASPERFAALAPLCGIGVPWYAFRLKDTPVWAFHGDQDGVIRVEESIWMTEAVNRFGGNARLTVYEGVGHDCWLQAYHDPELYEWMLAQRKP